MGKKTLLSWSTGKDCAWALHVLRQDPAIDVIGLFCTVNKEFNRVAMHGVRTKLLQQQASSVGLPLHIIEIPYPCSDDEYANAMSLFVEAAKKDEIECFGVSRMRKGVSLERNAVLEMRAGPSEPAYRRRFQTALSCV
ncbi:MAG: hypothetical protein FWD67_10200, partial [Betaproteobacteria bacterium]|nr:hypothetical protein [Betaproteobacteria bacterium]